MVQIGLLILLLLLRLMRLHFHQLDSPNRLTVKLLIECFKFKSILFTYMNACFKCDILKTQEKIKRKILTIFLGVPVCS
jgi:hypothetical protein